MNLKQQIIDTTECRRHNGQCEYGEWMALADDDVPTAVRTAITDEVAEAMHADMRHESHENTDDTGMVTLGGQMWVYRR